MNTSWKRLGNLLFLAVVASVMRLGFAVAQPAVIVQSNLVYGTAIDYTGSNVSLALDAYYVNGSQTNRPVVILTHGGGFGAGDKGYTVAQGNFYPDMATAFATNGFVAFSINYRLWPGCTGGCTQELDMAVADVMTALGWIRAHSAGYGIDATRVLIGGDSAGGGLAINASYQGTNLNSFLGCISLWGGVPPYGTDVHPVNDCPITSQTPPTCIIHGTADTVVPYAISAMLSSNLTAAGVYNELHPLAGDNHYPVMANNVYDTNLVRTIINYMLAFASLRTGSLPPAAPVPGAATAILTNGFTANWSASANAAGYFLDVATTSDFTSLVPGYSNLDVGQVTNRAVTGLLPNTTYYYRVRAYNGNGSSGNSTAIIVMTFAMMVIGPIRLGAPSWQAEYGQFSFSITGPANATVAIEQSTNQMNTWEAVATNQLPAGAAWFTNTVSAASQFFRARIILPY